MRRDRVVICSKCSCKSKEERREVVTGFGSVGLVTHGLSQKGEDMEKHGLECRGVRAQVPMTFKEEAASHVILAPGRMRGTRVDSLPKLSRMDCLSLDWGLKMQ